MLLFKKDFISDEGRILVEKCWFDRPYPAHKHEFIELVYILSGSGVHTVDDQRYRVNHGSFLFIDYGQVHRIIPDDKMTLINVLIEPEFFSKELVDIESIIEIFCYSIFAEFSDSIDNARQCVHFQNDEIITMDDLLETMLREYQRKQQGYLTVLRSSTQILFLWLLRKLSSREEIINDTVQDVLEYINVHFSEKIDLKYIAAKGFYNPDYLGRLLKKHCGKSFSQYVKEKRIGKAQQLLLTTQLSVGEIMVQCGYNDSKLFYKHFREIWAEPPGAFRKAGRNCPKNEPKKPETD